MRPSPPPTPTPPPPSPGRHPLHGTAGGGARSPMGITRFMYSLAVMLCDLTSFSTRTQMKPTVEQKIMCHMVRAMGKGNPE